MPITKFPPVELADEHGLLAVGGDLEVESLLNAYSHGIFPWPVFDEDVLTWFSPPMRAVLYTSEFHASRSLRRQYRNDRFEIRVNTAFRRVVENCAALINRGAQQGTWINRHVREAYCALHIAGYAHSIECWVEEELIGGLYGVAIGGMFAGESMFYRRANASKYCLLYLIEYLRERDIPWIDCQQQTELFASFGAKEIPREQFLRLLPELLSRNISLFKDNF